MNCPECNMAGARVQNTYTAVDGSKRRYRICQSCGEKFTTQENYVTPYTRVCFSAPPPLNSDAIEVTEPD